MADVLRVGEPPIDVHLRRNARARRLVLRVPRAGAAPTLTLPPGVGHRAATAFLLEREAWLRAHLAAAGLRIVVREGIALPFRGGTIMMRCGAERVVQEQGALLLPGGPDRLAARAAAFLKARARQDCQVAVAMYAERLGKKPGRLTMRDPRSRWGSCNAAGDLMFSWRLIMAPPEVLDYVAAHEVAHLAEMNHSARFWALVTRLCPDYAERRAWLRREGAGLHTYDFRAVQPD